MLRIAHRGCQNTGRIVCAHGLVQLVENMSDSLITTCLQPCLLGMCVHNGFRMLQGALAGPSFHLHSDGWFPVIQESSKAA